MEIIFILGNFRSDMLVVFAASGEELRSSGAHVALHIKMHEA
jgi:hypothetical protein